MPEWYTAGLLPPDKMTSSFERDMAGLHLARSSMSEHNEPDQAPVAPRLEHWEVLSGGQSLSECRDTVSWLSDACLVTVCHATGPEAFMPSYQGDCV